MSTSGTQVRPLSVTVLGWLWIVGSALAALSSLAVLVMLQLMRGWAPGGEFPPAVKDLPPGFGPFEWMFQHFGLLVGLHLAVYVFCIYAAVSFLRRRPWSRLCFEILCWLGVAYCVGFGIYWSYLWQGFLPSMPPGASGEGGLPFPAFSAMGIVMGVLVTLLNAAIPAVLIWFLRSRYVRPAFESA